MPLWAQPQVSLSNAGCLLPCSRVLTRPCLRLAVGHHQGLVLLLQAMQSCPALAACFRLPTVCAAPSIAIHCTSAFSPPRTPTLSTHPSNPTGAASCAPASLQWRTRGRARACCRSGCRSCSCTCCAQVRRPGGRGQVQAGAERQNGGPDKQTALEMTLVGG